MLRKNSNFLLGCHQAIDMMIVSMSFCIATSINTNQFPVKINGIAHDYIYHMTFAITLIALHLSMRLFGCYNKYRDQSLLQILSHVLKASLAGMISVIFISYHIHIEEISRLFFAIFSLLTIVLLVTFKTILFTSLCYYRRKNYNTRNILIIGSKKRAVDIIKAIMSTPQSGYKILGCLEIIEQKRHVNEIVFHDVRIIGTLEIYETILSERTVDELIFALPLKMVAGIHHYIYHAESMGINIKIVPDFQLDKIKYYPKTASIYLHHFMGIPTLCLTSTPSKETELIIKNIIDYIGAFLGLLFLSPLLATISIIIKLTSEGPIIFSQKRVGVNGRIFTIYKFRTMIRNAENLKENLMKDNEVSGPVFKIKKDPRINMIGGILRKTSMDELPQLVNILKGEMSLVGPRPPIPQEVSQYKFWQRRRLSMKPGLTCIWQVSGRNNTSFEDWMKMDLEYIDHWSLILDITILFKTIKEVTIGGGR